MKKPWGEPGPLTKKLVEGTLEIPVPAPPPSGTHVERLPRGGFRARLGKGLWSWTVVLAPDCVEIRRPFRKTRIPLRVLESVEITEGGLVFRYLQLR